MGFSDRTREYYPSVLQSVVVHYSFFNFLLFFEFNGIVTPQSNTVVKENVLFLQSLENTAFYSLISIMLNEKSPLDCSS